MAQAGEGIAVDLGIAGKVAVVTGGTRGIGRAIAELFAEEGADVAICARDADAVAATVEALAAKGVQASGAAVDVSEREAVADWIAGVAEEHAGLDMLVPNVSAFPVTNDPESWRSGFEVDLMGTINAIDAALPHLVESDAGSVTVISSVSAVEALGPARPYDAYKAALINYVKELSVDFAPKGVRLNTVSPGSIYFEGGRWAMAEKNDPARFKHYLDRNPLGRMGTPREVANATVFVASPAASFITGANLIVDGDLTRRVQF